MSLWLQRPQQIQELLLNIGDEYGRPQNVDNALPGSDFNELIEETSGVFSNLLFEETPGLFGFLIIDETGDP